MAMLVLTFVDFAKFASFGSFTAAVATAQQLFPVFATAPAPLPIAFDDSSLAR